MRTGQSLNLYKTNERTKNLKYYFSIFVAVVFIVFALSGYTDKNYNYILLGLLSLWYFAAFFISSNNFFNMFKSRTLTVFSFFIMFFALTCLFSSGATNAMKYTGEILIIFSPIMFYLYYSQLENKNFLKFILAVSVIAWSGFTIRALIFYQQNPNAARILASDKKAFDSIAIGGGYGLAYGSAVLCVYLFDCLINKRIKGGRNKFLAIIGIIMLAMLINSTKSTVTLLGTIFGIILCAMLRFTHSKGSSKDIMIKSGIAYILISVIMVTLILNMQVIGTSIVLQTQGKDDIISKRMNEIGAILATKNVNNGESSDFSTRMELIGISFNTFINNPILGAGYKYGYIFEKSSEVGVGNHNEWIDALAKYGLLGGVFYILIFLFALQNVYRKSNKKVSSGLAFIVIFLGFFNPFFSFQANLGLFFIISASEHLFAEKKGDFENEKINAV